MVQDTYGYLHLVVVRVDILETTSIVRLVRVIPLITSVVITLVTAWVSVSSIPPVV